MRGRSLLSAAHFLCVCAAALAAPGARFLVTAPGTIRPGANVTVGVELLENGPLQATVKAQVLKKASNTTVTVLEAEGVFERVLQKMQAACLPLPSPHPPHQDDHCPMPSPPEKSLPPSNCPGATLVLKPAGALAAHPAVCSPHSCQSAIEHSQCYHRCPPAPGCCSCALLTSMDYGSYQHLQKGLAAGRMAG